MTFAWTEEAVDQLRSLWIEGRSCTEIQKAIGAPTRNVVIGKAHRIGLQVHTGAHRQAPSAPAERRVRIRVERPARIPAPPRLPAVSRQSPPPRLSVVPMNEPRTLEQLGKRECKYILDDPGAGWMDRALYCAAPRDEAVPYCRRHMKLCFNPRVDKAKGRRA